MGESESVWLKGFSGAIPFHRESGKMLSLRSDLICYTQTSHTAARMYNMRFILN